MCRRRTGKHVCFKIRLNSFFIRRYIRILLVDTSVGFFDVFSSRRFRCLRLTWLRRRLLLRSGALWTLRVRSFRPVAPIWNNVFVYLWREFLLRIDWLAPLQWQRELDFPFIHSLHFFFSCVRGVSTNNQRMLFLCVVIRVEGTWMIEWENKEVIYFNIEPPVLFCCQNGLWRYRSMLQSIGVSKNCQIILTEKQANVFFFLVASWCPHYLRPLHPFF